MGARRLTVTILASLCTVVGVLSWSVSALAVRGYTFGSTFGSSGAGDGQLDKPAGVAVNEAAGYVYVVDKGNDRIERFGATGVYETQFDGSATPAKSFSEPEGIAVDNSCNLQKRSGSACSAADPSNEDVYVVDAGHSVIDKFSSTGAYLGQLTESPWIREELNGEFELSSEAFPFQKLYGVGVDAMGAVWVAQERDDGEENGIHEVYDFNQDVVNQFRGARKTQMTEQKPGLGVDAEDHLYLVSEIEGEEYIVKFDSEENNHQLNSPVASKSSTGLFVELSSGDLYVDNKTTIARFAPDGSLLERFGSGKLTAGSGVAINSVENVAYVADSATNTVDVFAPAPPAPPVVDGSVSDVASGSVTLTAEINPQGASTEYRFEYGSCASLSVCAASPYQSSVPLPDAFVGSDFELHTVSAHLTELSAETNYHYRVVAHNVEGTTDSPEKTFTTQPSGDELMLPDGRDWEMVSPADKQGASMLAIGMFSNEGGVIQASADGSSMTYVTSSPIEVNPQGNTNETQVLSQRGQDGWSSQDISTSNEHATGLSIGYGQEYRLFSTDLSLGIVQPSSIFGEAPLSEEASERTPYLRHDLSCTVSPGTCYEPLVTGRDGYANVPPGTEFASLGGIPPQFIDATPDLSHSVLSAEASLTSTHVAGTGGEALYEWTAGHFQLVSVLPESEGGKPLSNVGLGYLNEVVRHAISNDGSKVFWSDSESGDEHLYVRDTVRGETVRLDPANASHLQFQTASADGLRVFFTEGSTLYVCDLSEVAGKLQCKLTILAPEVQGAVLGTSEDGSYVYFVSNAVLAPGAEAGKCENSLRTDATCNLYVEHRNATEWENPRLIAALSAQDGPDWDAGDGGDKLSSLTARVSPNGGWLAFMSQRSLTGYDNRDAVSGQGDEEVYLYNASTAKLVCASCNPTGARPVGVEYGTGDKLYGGDRVWGSNTWIAANIPSWTPLREREAVYQSRFLSDDGRLFFNSNDGLVPQDVNSEQDVYEYEPPGLGSCTPSNSTFSERSDGCVGLISSGASPGESAFLDGSETGGDVFFLTSAKLVSQDMGTDLDVYDAHECSVPVPCFKAPVSPPPCVSSDSCRVAQSPQPSIFGAPPSATFSGIGNLSEPVSKAGVATRSVSRAQKLATALKGCHRLKGKKRRVVCERKARKRYAAKQSRRPVAAKKGHR